VLVKRPNLRRSQFQFARTTREPVDILKDSKCLISSVQGTKLARLQIDTNLRVFHFYFPDYAVRATVNWCSLYAFQPRK